MKLTEILRSIPNKESVTFELGSGKDKVKRSSVTAIITRLKNEEDIYLSSNKIKGTRKLVVKRIK